MIKPLAKEFVESLVTAAGFNVRKIYKIYNDYWPDTDNYKDQRDKFPWFLVVTQYGPIVIATRKKVYALYWDATSFKIKLPLREEHAGSTNEETYSHAWSEGELMDRLIALYSAFNEKERGIYS